MIVANASAGTAEAGTAGEQQVLLVLLKLSPYVANWVAVSTTARCTVGTTPLQHNIKPFHA
jgi:hypothetical protein